MHKIVIDKHVEDLANQYARAMSNKHGGSRTEDELNDLIRNIKDGNIVAKDKSYDIVEYLSQINRKYKELLVVHPNDFSKMISSFNDIIPTSDIAGVALEKIKDNQGKPLKKSQELLLHEEITRCLRYTYIQNKIFPSIIRELGIKTCVYCNAQYAITTENGHAFYQLDHFYPKSKYPYLSGSFFNLQPCCGACNIRKLDNDGKIVHGKYNISMWKEKDDEDNDTCKFEIECSSLASYQVNHVRDALFIDFLPANRSVSDIVKFTEEVNKTFNLSQLYQEHKDIVEEIVWKKQIIQKDILNHLEKHSVQFMEIPHRILTDLYQEPI